MLNTAKAGPQMKLDEKTVLFSGKPAKSADKTGRGPGRPTRQQIDARNREVIERALDLFLERGFEGTTVEAIIEAVGMSRRTFQSRYGDKFTLFKAALERAIGDYVVPHERLKAAESDDLEATLTAVARLMVARLRNPSGLRLVRIANSEIFRMPEITAYLWERTAQVSIDYLTHLFVRRLWPADEQMPIAKDGALAFLILVVEGAFQTMTWDHASEEQLDQQVVYRTKLFLNGV